MCDLTIMADHARIYDLHYGISSVPGDGIHSAFTELLGVKRAAYALLTGEAFDAETALAYGMVNGIHPGDKLLDRAYTLADHIMAQPRTVRRLTTRRARRSHLGHQTHWENVRSVNEALSRIRAAAQAPRRTPARAGQP